MEAVFKAVKSKSLGLFNCSIFLGRGKFRFAFPFLLSAAQRMALSSVKSQLSIIRTGTAGTTGIGMSDRSCAEKISESRSSSEIFSASL